MPTIFDLLYREYCRARLAEMRRQLLILPERHEVPEAICDAKDAVGEQAMTVWVYVNTSKQVGERDHLKVFATEVAAEIWFKKHDPEGVAFEYPVEAQ
jgi:hypothetical protein